jgi:hypothetical protein
MGIQIDKDYFLPQIRKSYSSGRFVDSGDKLSSQVLDVAQGWFDDPPFSRDITINSQKECRINLKYYILQEINLRDKNNSFFLPTFIWVWVAQKIISYIVKLLIEYYWRKEGASLYKQILKAQYDAE